MNEDVVNFADETSVYAYADLSDNCFMCYHPV